MNFHTIDWLIIAALLAVLFVGALSTLRYTKTVSAFLAANRCGGRYLILVAHGMAGLGVITLVGFFEQNYKVGYTALWWGQMHMPVLIIIGLSGWVVYRFRQTRAMTLAQFFEMRYSRRFRVFAGLVAYVSGIINFGIFPSIGARFFIAFCGLPAEVQLAGMEASTFPLVMAGLLAISLVFTFLGGHIAVMVTDFIQGTFANIVFVVIMVFLLLTFSWDEISWSLLQAPEGESMVNPFDLGAEENFNVWYYLIAIIITFYAVLGWQGTQGYNCCAKDAHEAKMAGILNGWRYWVLMHITIVVPVVVYALLHHPAYTEQAAQVNEALANIGAPDEHVREALQNQMRTPHALAAILPPGLQGLLGAAMLAAFISTHDTYLHSWGSIFVQDVVLPFRKRPLSPRQHLWMLRASIFGVAVFIFFFSLLFQHVQYIWMFCAITASIFVGGAGSVIIGGLYWKRGTTSGAWSALLAGFAFSGAGIIIKQLNPDFPLNGQELSFLAIVLAVGTYVGVSLLGPGRVFNMDKLLHRGEYAVEDEVVVQSGGARSWLERLGIDPEFTGGDRVVALVSVGWPIIWSIVFVAGTMYAIVAKPSDQSWLEYWKWWTWIILAAAIAITVWFTIGGLKDMAYMYRTLRSRAADPTDDGRVENEETQS
jgi:SSS family solute:Na+ symporter